ncbi:MAG: TaqI-like C-terminal specificity domain-containing protein [Anaerolineae bacterium]|jgi:methylase of polypeptide subunit release factors|nr:TaqI-like C-terminal specificity domain-containing protein [Anaerolineae bacterium]
MQNAAQQRVYELLQRMPEEGLSTVQKLFWDVLNYAFADSSLPYREWPGGTAALVCGAPRLLARHGDFEILYTPLVTLTLSAERQVIAQLLHHHPYALFVFSDAQAHTWHFVNIKPDHEEKESSAPAAQSVLRRIVIGPQERLHTAAEQLAQLGTAATPPDSPLTLQAIHDQAFNVEAVTREFFADYKRLFEQAESQITGVDAPEDLRIFTLRLFNRLLFIMFLERKGWLTFEGRHDYLRALWEAYQAEQSPPAEANFYRDRLTLLFFSGLNNPDSVDITGIHPRGFIQQRIGKVPYLNGGLFEREVLDEQEGIAVPDDLFAPLLDELLYRYNFTVTESTPLDVEVAVDPEMLGKIFEELVTGRHESGSYYTPKPVVAFMCREALKGYLHDVCPRETPEALAAFVEQQDPTAIRAPEAILAALRAVRICDPACGSGAYLLGMLHELIALRQALFVARGVDPQAVYEKKLEIIQQSLYGVDIDPFAVNIARLRLWLSLIVDFEGGTPPPLPNLEFKIEVGDSLAAHAPAQLQPGLFHYQQVADYFQLKGQFMTAHGPDKTELKRQILALQEGIAAWASEKSSSGTFDWEVVFAEVFTPKEEASPDKSPRTGFDIVVTNPPYVRQELLGSDLKALLQKRYAEIYTGTADLYVYFYARALHLLREGGIGSFITSNKWLRAGYGEKLRWLLNSQATLENIIDFGDLPLFTAIAYPCITVFRKAKPPEDHAVRALTVDDLGVVEHLQETVAAKAWRQPRASLPSSGWTLARPAIGALMRKLRLSGIPLGESINGKIYYGIKTGYNQAFVIDEQTRDHLIAQDPRSAEVIKPWLRGRDIKRWQIAPISTYLIALQNSDDKDAHNPWGTAGTEAEARAIFASTYPAIHAHLSQYEPRLRIRQDQGKYWWELRACAYYKNFSGPKIIYPDIAKQPEFSLDTSGAYSVNTTYFISTKDLYLLGLLNSSVTEFFYRQVSTTIQQGYLRFFAQYMEQIPIPPSSQTQQTTIEELVEHILSTNSENSRITAWEQELNALIYQVYGLTEDEVALIEETLTP